MQKFLGGVGGRGKQSVLCRASSVPIFPIFLNFPYLVCKCPIIPVIPSENKNRLKFMNVCWWNDKDSEFFGPSKTKLVIRLLLVHVSVLNLMLL